MDEPLEQALQDGIIVPLGVFYDHKITAHRSDPFYACERTGHVFAEPDLIDYVRIHRQDPLRAPEQEPHGLRNWVHSPAMLQIIGSGSVFITTLPPKKHIKGAPILRTYYDRLRIYGTTGLQEALFHEQFQS